MRVARWVSRACVPLLRQMAVELQLLGSPLAAVAPSHALAAASLTAGDPVAWDVEYVWLCAKLSLPPLLPAPTNPMAPAAPYYVPEAGVAAWGELGERDGALWKMLHAWAAHLALARRASTPGDGDGGGGIGECKEAGQGAMVCSSKGFWRAPALGGPAAWCLPRLVTLPSVFQELVNKHSSLFEKR